LAAAAALGIVMFGSGRLALKNTYEFDNSPRAIAARGGGSMLYGIIAAFDMRISNGTVSDTLDCASTQPFVRTPEKPSSTR
jgi:hypothetical protein